MLQIRINHIIISNAGFGVIVQGMDLLVCGFYSKEQTDILISSPFLRGEGSRQQRI